MSRKIIGVTVGTPLGISAIREKLKPITSVNGQTPDENGNVEIAVGGGDTALTTAQIEALHGMFKVCAYDDSKDVSGAYAAFKTAFGITDSGEEEPDEPDTPEVALTSISAVYSGGDVTVGTAVADLTGIVVTAHYSDGTSETVAGYTLSGTIAEGSNTVTVSYGGKTATFTVTGVAESGGKELTLVALASMRTVTNLYSDAGETVFADKATIGTVTQWYVDTVFDVDTEVTIAVLYGSNNTSLKQFACCVSSLESTDGYYAETIGYAQTKEYTYKYTVRAGHYLRILNFNSGTPTSVTVTK